MRSWGAWVLVLFVGCGGGRERGSVDGATTPPGSDGGTERPDTSAPVDGSLPMADGSVPVTEACEPTPGSETISGYCQQVMISVLRRDGLPTALEARGITTSVGDGCRVVDSVELLDADGTVQVLAGVTPEARPGMETFVARADETAPALEALCDGDEGRYDPYEVVVHGHMDGGSFVARCGAELDGGFGWPPDSVVTCHRNLPTGPTFMGGAEVQVNSAFTATQLWFSYPNVGGIAIDSVASDLRVVPTADPFGGGFADPIASTGWDTSVSFETSEHRFISVQMSLLEDPFGTDLCPTPDTSGDPSTEFPPVLRVALTGSGAMGAFESEAYVDTCYRISLMGGAP